MDDNNHHELQSEVIGPGGSGGPLETGHVICPACAHNFQAVPQNAQERIKVLEQLLTEADRLIVWETAMPNGREFQERIERALKRNDQK